MIAARHGTVEQGPTSRQSERHRAALAALKEEQPSYDARIAVADPAASCDDPESLCRDLLVRLRAMLGAGDAAAWNVFVTWAQETKGLPRILHVLAAVAAGLEDDWPQMFQHAKAATAMSQRDTFAQRLFLRARERIEGRVGAEPDDLAEFFCPAPFETFELCSSGDVHTCCPAWLPVPIGNLHRQTPGEIWNSPAAQAIRGSILDGSFRHCSRLHCPAIVNRRLPRRADLKNSYHREIVRGTSSTSSAGPYGC